MSDKYNNYLQTDYWKAVASAVKKRDGYRCRLCNSQHGLIAHHRTYDHREREMEFLEDLTTLCRHCHEKFHDILNPAPVQKPVERCEKPKHKFRTKQKNLEAEANWALIYANRRKEDEKIQAAKEMLNTPSVVDDDMPPGDEVILTRELVDRCRTAAGAFTNASLRALGICAKPKAGWPSRLVGTVLTSPQYRSALEGRYLYGTGRLPPASENSI